MNNFNYQTNPFRADFSQVIGFSYPNPRNFQSKVITDVTVLYNKCISDCRNFLEADRFLDAEITIRNGLNLNLLDPNQKALLYWHLLTYLKKQKKWLTFEAEANKIFSIEGLEPGIRAMLRERVLSAMILQSKFDHATTILSNSATLHSTDNAPWLKGKMYVHKAVIANHIKNFKLSINYSEHGLSLNLSASVNASLESILAIALNNTKKFNSSKKHIILAKRLKPEDTETRARITVCFVANLINTEKFDLAKYQISNLFQNRTLQQDKETIATLDSYFGKILVYELFKNPFTLDKLFIKI